MNPSYSRRLVHALAAIMTSQLLLAPLSHTSAGAPAPDQPSTSRLPATGRALIGIGVEAAQIGLKVDSNARTTSGCAPTTNASVVLRISARMNAGTAPAVIEMRLCKALALAPLTGWSSYSNCHLRVSHGLMRVQAGALVSSDPQDHGYDYLSICDVRPVSECSDRIRSISSARVQPSKGRASLGPATQFARIKHLIDAFESPIAPVPRDRRAAIKRQLPIPTRARDLCRHIELDSHWKLTITVATHGEEMLAVWSPVDSTTGDTAS